jgi:protein-disulfide isomerase
VKQRVIVVAALAGAAFFGAVVANLVAAQQSRPTTPSNIDRAAIEQIVRDTIREDPAIIVEALNLYSENHVKDTARKYLPELLSNESGYVAGKNVAGAKVAVIEFFDYHCGFCKRSASFVQDLIKNDASVKVAFREYPILREESEIASRYALAARQQGKYTDLHFALLKENGVITEARIKEVAKAIGLNVKQLEADAKNPAFDSIFDEDRRAGQEMGIDGTPTFIVASLDGEFIELIPGFRPDDVKAAIAEAKKQR